MTNAFKVGDHVTWNSEAGHVSGVSQRFIGGTNAGNSAWLYNGATTINIGLTGSQHTRNDGYKDSAARGDRELGRAGDRRQIERADRAGGGGDDGRDGVDDPVGRRCVATARSTGLARLGPVHGDGQVRVAGELDPVLAAG